MGRGEGSVKMLSLHLFEKILMGRLEGEAMAGGSCCADVWMSGVWVLVTFPLFGSRQENQQRPHFDSNKLKSLRINFI